MSSAKHKADAFSHPETCPFSSDCFPPRKQQDFPLHKTDISGAGVIAYKVLALHTANMD